MTAIQDWTEERVLTTEVSAEHLGDKVKVRLLREAVRMYEANQRQGNAKTKTRAETNFTERKPYRQKGTGNARRGDRNSPLLRGGGTAFGPRPRDYSYHMPRKALREALRSALLGKLRDGEVHHIPSQAFHAPSTKTAARVVADLGLSGSAAVVIPADNPTLWKSFRNLPRVHVIRASDLNAFHVLWHRDVVLVDDAWDVLSARLGSAAAETAA